MKTFDELWKDIEERSQRWAIPIVQDKAELEHVFNLMKGCKTYLEIGSAEGNTLYVLGHVLNPTEDSERYLYYVDFGEKHTQAPRDEAIKRLEALGIFPAGMLGNSHSAELINILNAPNKIMKEYDAVLIDAGHTYEDVIADAIAYGHLATKYIFFHDIQLPEVRKAFNWYCAQNPQFKVSTFINSQTFGYGIIEI